MTQKLSTFLNRKYDSAAVMSAQANVAQIAFLIVQDNDSTIWITDDAILLVFFFDRKASRSKLANYI